MKKVVILIQVLAFIGLSAYSQDTLVVTTLKGDKIQEVKPDTIKIAKEDQVREDSFNAAPDSKIDLNAVQTFETPLGADKVIIGFGFGLDHGGYGVNILAYPIKNFGLFAGIGYNLVGVGFNAGAKIRLISPRPEAMVSPHFVIMGGYNAVIKVTNATELNKTFYGPTIGLGVDLKYSTIGKDYMSFSILLPLRSEEVQDYIDDLTQNHGVIFERELLPIGISLSYRMILK